MRKFYKVEKMHKDMNAHYATLERKLYASSKAVFGDGFSFPVYGNFLAGYAPSAGRNAKAILRDSYLVPSRMVTADYNKRWQYSASAHGYKEEKLRFHIPVEKYLGIGAFTSPMQRLAPYNKFCSTCGSQQWGQYKQKTTYGGH